jgi:acetyltransferase-like isoleucine patch superfamily enzyme
MPVVSSADNLFAPYASLKDTPLGSHGFEFPEYTTLESITVAPDSLPRLATSGISVAGPFGPNNRILFDPSHAGLHLQIRINGRSNNMIILESGHNLKSSSVVSLEGDGHLAIFRAARGISGLIVTMRRNAGVFYYGKNSTSNSTNSLIYGPAHICIGEDAMFATETGIRTFDSHAIVDTVTRRQINLPENVLIEPHVWVGARALIMQGVRVGAGSIVAASALVTRDMPPKTLWAGVPAKQLREDVTWTRSEFPTVSEIDQTVAQVDRWLP